MQLGNNIPNNFLQSDNSFGGYIENSNAQGNVHSIASTYDWTQVFRSRAHKESLDTDDTTLSVNTDDIDFYLDIQKALQKKKLRDIVKLEEKKQKDKDNVNKKESD